MSEIIHAKPRIDGQNCQNLLLFTGSRDNSIPCARMGTVEILTENILRPFTKLSKITKVPMRALMMENEFFCSFPISSVFVRQCRVTSLVYLTCFKNLQFFSTVFNKSLQ